MSGYRKAGTVDDPWLPPRAGPYTELSALAKALAAPYAGALTLDADVHGMRLSIGLLLDSGTVVGISFRVTGRTWPSVIFRRELEEDRDAKTEALTRELQTGDDAFDRDVFVESDVPDDVLKRLLETEGRRQAILALVGEAERVVFDDDGIFVELRGLEATDASWAEAHVLSHLRTLADGPGLPAQHYPTPHDRLERALGWLGVASLVSSVAGWALLGMIGSLSRAGTAWLGILGGVAGVLLVFPAKRLLRLAVRGHSRAHAQYFLGTASLLLIFVSWGSLLPMIVNTTVDAEPRRPVHGVVTTIGGGDDESVVAHVRWDDGSNDDDIVILRPPGKVGDRVRSTQRRGLLDWRWQKRGDAFVEP
jgi:hypothetical protein